MKKKVVMHGTTLLLAITLLGCSNGKSEVDECINRGIVYYKEIGSYPTLSTGENAQAKVTERCNRTTTAF